MKWWKKKSGLTSWADMALKSTPNFRTQNLNQNSMILAPIVQRQLGRLSQRFKWNVAGRGSLPGRDGGRRLGSAGEFESYRSFEPGDDLRALDLKVYSRLRKRMARVLREDSTVPLTILVDRSASMEGWDRQRACCELIYFFNQLSRVSADPIRIFSFGDGALSGESNQILRNAKSIVDWSNQRQPEGETDFASEFRVLPKDPSGRGVVIVLSDSMGLKNPENELLPLSKVGRVFWLALLEPNELDPQWQGKMTLSPREGGEQWRGTIDADSCEKYRAVLQRYFDAIARSLRRGGGDLYVLPVEMPTSELIERVFRQGGLLR